MTNDIRNYFNVIGSAKAIDRFRVTSFAGGSLSFDSFIPMPHVIRDSEVFPLKPQRVRDAEEIIRIHETGFKDSYDWSVANWGTECDAYDLEIRRDEKDWLEFVFTTPWSPPVSVFKKIAELFPTLFMSILTIEEFEEYVLSAVIAHGEYVGRRQSAPTLMMEGEQTSPASAVAGDRGLAYTSA